MQYFLPLLQVIYLFGHISFWLFTFGLTKQKNQLALDFTSRPAILILHDFYNLFAT